MVCERVVISDIKHVKFKVIEMNLRDARLIELLKEYHKSERYGVSASTC